jgi:hypothetical protein
MLRQPKVMSLAGGRSINLDILAQVEINSPRCDQLRDPRECLVLFVSQA